MLLYFCLNGLHVPPVISQPIELKDCFLPSLPHPIGLRQIRYSKKVSQERTLRNKELEQGRRAKQATILIN